jgi:hypothetical protein
MSVAELICQLDLVERVLEQFVLATLTPRTRQLVLVEDPELHLILPERIVRRSALYELQYVLGRG